MTGSYPANTVPGETIPGTVPALIGWLGQHALAQLLMLAATVLLFGMIGGNMLANMDRFGINPGFGFLDHAANFEIGESLLPYSASDSYGHALAVGLVNTIKVAVVGCVLASLLGLALGIARLSGNLLLSGMVQAYIELVRSTPLLLQLFFWSATLHALPGPRQAFEPVPGVFLCNRGIFLPALTFDPLGMQVPVLGGFNFTGGLTLSPEFATLLIGLTVHAAAIIAEIVRSGIQSVPAGQWEAARALGLPRRRIMRLVILPQALRVIVPLLTSSWLNLTKNSSLAVAIGFPDLVSVINTSANQSGQALECMAILAAAYLSLSLGVSVVMNRWNRRLIERGWQ